MNNLDQIIRSRRAIYPKQFENGDISKNTLLNILGNGNMAPSHRLTLTMDIQNFSILIKNKVR